ncbi:Domain of uncharacterised function (DUF368) [Candidatus Ornithobacterium hominis]|uniref:Domain of uncharacterized function (DUF368) n=1 Tax=Candidatus Ornithobacterium hominis TaxID=2497989 RepID=A0A383U012_9FLAO|nr:DUF368 domain-containing protein [Candidatus Ornithobacterium hominis]MCT7904284.1 DUF368 domain-containing protein [Candidatus Ornithobacterium hominis]CAI9429499.1 DUF368 domain-containing protein [Candidatus Ornithobacterium hominis]SZD72947.1 Domain of uncharacterised function (DUF368) [Candidatus Ornithobacterium hominis]
MGNRTFLSYFILWFKGLLMGTANKIPGVSGGMVALVTGFYEELIYSFQKFNSKAWKLLWNRRWSQFLQYINFKFLFAVNFGSVSAFFTISLLLDYIMRPVSQNGLGYQISVWSFFFGMIIGSAYYVWDKITRFSRNVFLGIIIGVSIGLYISFLDPMLPNENLWFILLCGIISVSGMTLPGFSGSFILIILGNYNLLLVESVNNLFYTILAIFNNDWQNLGTVTPEEYTTRVHLLKIMAVFAIGSLVGLVSFSKIMGYLLKNYHNIVLGWLMGFIIASLGAAWPWKSQDLNEQQQLLGYTRYMPEVGLEFYYQIGVIILGILSIVIFNFYEKKASKF